MNTSYYRDVKDVKIIPAEVVYDFADICRHFKDGNRVNIGKYTDVRITAMHTCGPMSELSLTMIDNNGHTQNIKVKVQ